MSNWQLFRVRLIVREGAELPSTITSGGLDLNHAGTEVGKNFATIGTRDALGEFQDLDIG